MFFCNLIIYVFLIFEIETGKIRPNFDEIFGNEWDKNKSEEKAIKLEDQMEQNENIFFVGQLDEENGNDPNDQHKIETIRKYEAIKENLREKGKLQSNDRIKIETKIGKLLGTNREKIYKWKKEMNLNKIKKMENSFYEKKKYEFTERIDEFKSLYGQRKQKEFVKELGISHDTFRKFRKWKKELMPKYHKTHKNHSNEDKLRKMNQYFEIKGKHPKNSDEIIAKKLGIARNTLRRWKKKFASISKL